MTSLDLEHNEIGVEGAKSLSKLLEMLFSAETENSSNLSFVHLKNNDLRDEGAEMISNALSKSHTLTSVDLEA